MFPSLTEAVGEVVENLLVSPKINAIIVKAYYTDDSPPYVPMYSVHDEGHLHVGGLARIVAVFATIR